MAPNSDVSYTSAVPASPRSRLSGRGSSSTVRSISLPVISEKKRVSTSWSKLIRRAPAVNSTRCARLNGYCTTPLAPRLICVMRCVCSTKAWPPSTVVMPCANPPVTYGVCSPTMPQFQRDVRLM